MRSLMSRCIRAIAAAALVAASTACASSGGTSNPKPTIKPPELLSRTRPELSASGVVPNAPRPATLVEVEVKVNPDGNPDMSTLKITGQGAGTNRNAITTWVQGLRFKPATQDGVPVIGTYKTSFGAS